MSAHMADPQGLHGLAWACLLPLFPQKVDNGFPSLKEDISVSPDAVLQTICTGTNFTQCQNATGSCHQLGEQVGLPSKESTAESHIIISYTFRSIPVLCVCQADLLWVTSIPGIFSHLNLLFSISHTGKGWKRRPHQPKSAAWVNSFLCGRVISFRYACNCTLGYFNFATIYTFLIVCPEDVKAVFDCNSVIICYLCPTL